MYVSIRSRNPLPKQIAETYALLRRAMAKASPPARTSVAAPDTATARVRRSDSPSIMSPLAVIWLVWGIAWCVGLCV